MNTSDQLDASSGHFDQPLVGNCFQCNAFPNGSDAVSFYSPVRRLQSSRKRRTTGLR
jgi:hypothetical protein